MDARDDCIRTNSHTSLAPDEHSPMGARS
jgi:hypothetical protein